MVDDSAVQAAEDELAILVDQLRANPPSGSILLSNSEDGALVAIWESDGTPCRVGPAKTVPLPPTE